MTIVTLVSGCGYAYPGHGTRECSYSMCNRHADAMAPSVEEEQPHRDARVGDQEQRRPEIVPPSSCLLVGCKHCGVARMRLVANALARASAV